jgi:hypothetical protein
MNLKLELFETDYYSKRYEESYYLLVEDSKNMVWKTWRLVIN